MISILKCSHSFHGLQRIVNYESKRLLLGAAVFGAILE